MAHVKFESNGERPRVVGSFGSMMDLGESNALGLNGCCDIAEIRLDLIAPDTGDALAAPWDHLGSFPLLFTARRAEEGGARTLSARQRTELLLESLDHASLVDIEVASIDEMRDLLATLERRQIPWIASFHDFETLPSLKKLEQAVQRAKDAGAAAFKTAAMLAQPADLARLAEFQMADHGLPVATMGMGPLAPVSRLLCAQCGSFLNYGYIGKTPTAPGQWDSRLLKQAISRLIPIKY